MPCKVLVPALMVAVLVWCPAQARGGWTAGPVWVWRHGERATGPDWFAQPPVPLRINSAHISGDGRANLVAVAL